MQLRALVSSADAGRNWDLRCRVREAMLAFMQREYPDALPRMRAELQGGATPPSEKTSAEKAVEKGAARGAVDKNAPAQGRATPEPAEA